MSQPSATTAMVITIRGRSRVSVSTKFAHAWLIARLFFRRDSAFSGSRF